MALSAAALRICGIAVDYLADRGYDRCSLAEVAELAGMRKASLYSHFRNKDALFKELLALALSEERAFAEACFAADSGRPVGGEYLSRISDRFRSSTHLRFLLRTAYAPPASIRAEVGEIHETLLADVRGAFRDALPAGLVTRDADTLTEAYVGVLDGIQVELVYGDVANVENRRAALWTLVSSYAQTRNKVGP